MGFVTLLLLGAFSLLYIGNSLPKKPAFIDKAIKWIEANMRYLALGGLIYGFVAFCLTPIAGGALRPWDMCARMWANLFLVVMALPHCFDVLIAKYRDKINTAILQESRGLIAFISGNQKIFGALGAATCALLFVAVFGHM